MGVRRGIQLFGKSFVIRAGHYCAGVRSGISCSKIRTVHVGVRSGTQFLHNRLVKKGHDSIVLGSEMDLIEDKNQHVRVRCEAQFLHLQVGEKGHDTIVLGSEVGSHQREEPACWCQKWDPILA